MDDLILVIQIYPHIVLSDVYMQRVYHLLRNSFIDQALQCLHLCVESVEMSEIAQILLLKFMTEMNQTKSMNISSVEACSILSDFLQSKPENYFLIHSVNEIHTMLTDTSSHYSDFGVFITPEVYFSGSIEYVDDIIKTRVHEHVIELYIPLYDTKKDSLDKLIDYKQLKSAGAGVKQICRSYLNASLDTLDFVMMTHILNEFQFNFFELQTLTKQLIIKINDSLILIGPVIIQLHFMIIQSKMWMYFL